MGHFSIASGTNVTVVGNCTLEVDAYSFAMGGDGYANLKVSEYDSTLITDIRYDLGTG